MFVKNNFNRKCNKSTKIYSAKAPIMETDRLEQTTQNSKVRSRQNEETKYWKEELDKLLVDKREQLSLPPSISKKQRYELHKYAAKIGLKSKSTGKGNIQSVIDSFCLFFNVYIDFLSNFKVTIDF